MLSIKNSKVQPYLTPYKYPKPVLCASAKEGAFDSLAVDIPFVFWHNEQWYMLYTGFDGIGYQSALATSDDLVNWEHLCVIMSHSRGSGKWDEIGAAATWILKDTNDLTHKPTLKKVDGKYWLVYHSYPSSGYEAGPAEIGIAYCDCEDLKTWSRVEKPVFSWKQGQEWEVGGLYKACIMYHEEKYWLFYNAKDTQQRWVEQTGVAFSTDLINWERYNANPILKVRENQWDSRFVSDPCIIKHEDTWLNFFFGLGTAHALEGLAFSEDLLNWERVNEPIIENGQAGSLDESHAHKASVVLHNGVLYHFYCAVRPWKQGDESCLRNEFRCIALATSKPL